MIPKIIHLCWFSKDPYPKAIAKCLASWRVHLKDYEVVLWNFDRFPRGKSKWVDDAFDNRKYAFAADYIRAYALYNYGGIYLDSDVEVLKNFDDFLHLPYMIGRESDSLKIEAAVMGSEKGNPIFKDLLEYYENRDFIKEDGSFDVRPLPCIMMDIVESRGRIADIASISEFGDDSGTFYLFRPDFFSPLHIVNLELELTPNSVTIHRFSGSWQSETHQFKKKVQKLIGPRLTLAVQRIKHSLSRN